VSHLFKGFHDKEAEVKTRNVIDYCDLKNIFHVKVEGDRKYRGLIEAFEYGPYNHILDSTSENEVNVEKTIFDQLYSKIAYEKDIEAETKKVQDAFRD
jgi:hypothetical protein